MTNTTYDISGFAENLGLEIKDVADLFSQYLIEINDYKNKMKTLSTEKSYTELEHILHTIKGVSGNLWISDVYELAETYDNLLKKNITENTEIHVSNLASLIENAVIKIKKTFYNAGIKIE